MAIAVSVGGGNDFNALVYGANKHPGTLQFLENQFQNLSSTLTDAGRSFFADAKQIYDRFNGSEAMRLARAAVNQASHLFQSDCIREIRSLSDFQTAPLTMQRFIMAEPTVREMYHQQRCDGYSDTYVDMSPGVVGQHHYDYRRVMNGMVMEQPDGSERTTFYLDELPEGDRELGLDEKVAIHNTWEFVADLMKFGKEDPTSVWNNNL